MMTEREYIQRIPIEHRKKYAQFFTPEPISDFMATWVLDGKEGKVNVLEPAFGLGVFSRSMHKINPEIRVMGYDSDKIIYAYANDNFDSSRYDIRICNENYLTASWTEKFDSIICNPPYLKFHDYDNATLVPMVNGKLHTHLNGFTNIYTLFLLKSIFQLNNNGRLAYVIPSEFLNADYGVEVKRALLQSGVLRHIIIVDFTQCAFDDALTTACILLCENNGDSDAIHFSNITDVSKLNTSLTDYKTFTPDQLDPAVKWKHYYETSKSSSFTHLVPFSTFAKVSRGIATGANDYFTFKASKIDKYGIPENSFRRCICHAADVRNLVFTDADFENVVNLDKTVFLFDGCANEDNPHVQNYLKLGEKSGADKKYLTASRNPWYALENRHPSPIWVSVFNRNGLRFVRNQAGVYNLTTFHCVYNVGEIDTDILFAYLVTSVAKEIFLDNSRQYGNGLVKFEPNDLNKGNVVDLRLLSEEERTFVLRVSDIFQYGSETCNQAVSILDDFFRTKFTGGAIDLLSYFKRLNRLSVKGSKVQNVKVKAKRIKQLSFYELYDQYAENPITENYMVHETVNWEDNSFSDHMQVDLSKNVLISLVKPDNVEPYLDRSAKIYYTGKRFPSTVALNELYYFMPYIKRKGIRDIYLIKVARVGTRKEGQQDNDPNDFRLVFEIEFVKQLFKDFKPTELKIWRTFTDTTLRGLLAESDCGTPLHKRPVCAESK